MLIRRSERMALGTTAVSARNIFNRCLHCVNNPNRGCLTPTLVLCIYVRATLQAKARDEADCCDVTGESVLTSEIDAWNVSYLADQVFGTPGKGEAQERRARALCKIAEKGDFCANSSRCCVCFLPLSRRASFLLLFFTSLVMSLAL